MSPNNTGCKLPACFLLLFQPRKSSSVVLVKSPEERLLNWRRYYLSSGGTCQRHDKPTQPHLGKQLGFISVYTAANFDQVCPRNLGEEKQRACFTLSAVLVKCVIRVDHIPYGSKQWSCKCKVVVTASTLKLWKYIWNMVPINAYSTTHFSCQMIYNV